MNSQALLTLNKLHSLFFIIVSTEETINVLTTVAGVHVAGPYAPVRSCVSIATQILIAEIIQLFHFQQCFQMLPVVRS